MLRRTLRYAIGILCLVLGLLALITPLTPGAWLIFVGLELLGLDFLLPKRLRDYWRELKKKLLAWRENRRRR
jgi:uncharacterized protein YqgC (DUF456 family)